MAKYNVKAKIRSLFDVKYASNQMATFTIEMRSPNSDRNNVSTIKMTKMGPKLISVRSHRYSTIAFKTISTITKDAIRDF